MKQNFLAVKKFLEGKYPDLVGKVTGSNFPAPPIIDVLLKILTGVQLLTMALIMFGDRLWTNILRFRQVPSWYYPIKQHGFQCALLVFFFIPTMLSRYVVTGAFEIMVDGEPAYSKLEMGRMPTLVDIAMAFDKLGMTVAAQS
jgi:selT/selW/selH-like putative selenoprotein